MNKVLITIGPVSIYWYSFLILVAVLIGSRIAEKYAPKLNLPSMLVSDTIIGIVIWSVIGARLYYVIFNFENYKSNLIEIFKIWKGGLAIYGAIIAGIIYLYKYCHQHEISIIKVLDLYSLSLLLGQAIGRWGNFFNQEAYGPITTKAFLETLHLPTFIINGMYIEGAYRTPTFLYESIWCLIGAIILFIIRHRKTPQTGNQLSFYLIWYGIGRFLIEYLRTDSLYIGNLKISMIVSLIIIVLGLIIYIRNLRKNKVMKNYAKVGGQ